MQALLFELGTFVDILVHLFLQEGMEERLANELADEFAARADAAQDSEEGQQELDLLFAVLCLSMGRAPVDCPIAPTHGGVPGSLVLLIGNGCLEYDPGWGYMIPAGEMYIHENAREHFFNNLLEKECSRAVDATPAEFRVEWYTELRPRRRAVCEMFGDSAYGLGEVPWDILRDVTDAAFLQHELLGK